MTSKSKAVFSVQERKKSDKSAKNARIQGDVLANIYGLGKESQTIQMDRKTFANLYSRTGDSGLAYLKVGESSKEEAVLIDEIQRHPLTGVIMHASFRRVNLTEKITAEIPIELVGENSIPQATVVLVRDTLEVNALPTDLPENFTIDISQLTEIGQTVAIKDLKYDKTLVELVLTGDITEEAPIVILQEVKEEVEVDEVAPGDVELVDGGEKADSSEGGDTTEQKSDDDNADKAE